MKTWYVFANNKQSGPFSDQEVKDSLSQNVFSENSLLFKVGWKEWRPLKDALAEIEGSAPLPPAPPHKGAPERRKFPRATISGEVVVHNNKNITHSLGVDISASGMFIETHEEIFSVGETIKATCRIQKLSKPFNIQAQVIRFTTASTHQPSGYGLKFLKIDADRVTEIQKLIDRENTGIFLQSA